MHTKACRPRKCNATFLASCRFLRSVRQLCRVVLVGAVSAEKRECRQRIDATPQGGRRLCSIIHQWQHAEQRSGTTHTTGCEPTQAPKGNANTLCIAGCAAPRNAKCEPDLPQGDRSSPSVALRCVALRCVNTAVHSTRHPTSASQSNKTFGPTALTVVIKPTSQTQYQTKHNKT